MKCVALEGKQRTLVCCHYMPRNGPCVVEGLDGSGALFFFPKAISEDLKDTLEQAVEALPL